MRLALAQATGLFQKVIILINLAGEVVIKILSKETQNYRLSNAIIVKYAGDFSFDIFPGLQTPGFKGLFEFCVWSKIRESGIDSQRQLLTF